MVPNVLPFLSLLHIAYSLLLLLVRTFQPCPWNSYCLSTYFCFLLVMKKLEYLKNLKRPWQGHPTICGFQQKREVQGLLCLQIFEKWTVEEYFSAKRALEGAGYNPHPPPATAILPWCPWRHLLHGAEPVVSDQKFNRCKYFNFTRNWPQNNIVRWNAYARTASCLLCHGSRVHQRCQTLGMLAH